MGSPISVRTIVGGAGSGKTRFAIELIESLSDWEAGFVHSENLRKFVETGTVSRWEWNKPTLIVLDYAAVSAQTLKKLFCALAECQEEVKYPATVSLARTGSLAGKRLVQNAPGRRIQQCQRARPV